MFAEIVQNIIEKAIKFGTFQIVDNVHSVAIVNTRKDIKREIKEKVPHGLDAKLGVKHKRKMKTLKGNKIEPTDYFYGYKAHMSMNAGTRLISSLEKNSGEAYDCHHFCSLVKKTKKTSSQ